MNSPKIGQEHHPRGAARRRVRRSAKAALLSTSILVPLALASHGLAAEKPAASANGAASDPEGLRALIEEQREELRQQRRALAEQQRRLDQLETQLNAGSGIRSAAYGQRARGTSDGLYRPGHHKPTTDSGSGGQVAQAPATDSSPANSPAGSSPAREALPEQTGAGVLLAPGKMVLESSLEYQRIDTNRAEIAGFTVLPGIVVGNISITEANRDTLVAAENFRVGLFDNLEAEIKVPYVYRSDRTTTRPLGTGASQDVTTEATGSGLGDIEGSLHYQINEGRQDWPVFVGNLRVKSRTGKDPFEVDRDPTTNVETELPTGSGFWSVEPSITAIVPSDPAVIFGNINYAYNIERDVGGGFGEIDPGDSVGFNVGVGLSMNDQLSVSLNYDHKTVFETKQNGATLQGSEVLQVGRMSIGSFYRFNERVGLGFTVGSGITEDSPDLSLTVRVPVNLN